VATAFLIMLVLVLASLIYFWARGFVSEQIEKWGQPVEQICSSVDFEIALLQDFSGGAGSRTLEVVNRGNVDIYHLDLKKFDEKGNSEISKFKFHIDAGGSATGLVNLRMTDGSEPKKVIVYPALIGAVKGKPLNKVFTCNDMGKMLEQ
jgi:hypothetical protein